MLEFSPNRSLHATKGVSGDAFSSPPVRTGCYCCSHVWFLAAFGRPERGLPDSAPIATIGAGSTVAVNVDVVLPANQGIIYFQNGAMTTWEQVDKKAPSCRLSAVESPVVRRLVPGRKIVITGTRQNNASVNFYGDVLRIRRRRHSQRVAVRSGT